jgi:phage tail-like protein
VPDVTGLGLTTAEKILRSAGFHEVRPHLVESYDRNDTVVGQVPDRGALLEESQPVVVKIARTSWVRQLPTAYQPRRPEDPSFLRDFLWIFQHMLDTITRQIDSMHDVFHPYTTPPEFLNWLASWFAISFDEGMPEARRRRLLKEAALLYRIRGTREALVRMVQLFTDLDVTIEENRWPYKGFRIGVHSQIGVDTMILPEVPMSQTFIVHLPCPFDVIGPDKLIRLHQVIQTEKPASTNYFLQAPGEEGVTEVTGMRVGVTSLIGVEADEAPDPSEPPSDLEAEHA